MKHILLPITTLIILISCQSNNNLQDDKFQLLLPDTSKTLKPNYTFEYLRKFSRQMGLPNIDTGANEFELRIWTGSIIDPDQIVLLRKAGATTIAQKFDYNSSFDSLKYYKLTDTYQNTALTQFADSLQKTDFKTLISQNEIKNFQDNIADGITYHMEISTPRYYKLITYHCPEHFAKTEPNNKRFLDLVLAVDRHLHFYSPKCSF